MSHLIAADSETREPGPFPVQPRLQRNLVLVGLMGAGKSSVGRRLAHRLGLPFADADSEIETAAGCTIPDFFERFGEAEFRRGEQRVIIRLLETGPRVLATGGGAFMADATRAAIRERALSVWLRAELDVLWERVSRRAGRPMLHTEDPKQTLRALMAQRYPVYAQADLTVESLRGPIDATVDQVMAAIALHAGPAGPAGAGR